MKIIPEKRLFWFLKDDIELDLSDESVLEMYIQQVITHGNTEDIKNIFKNIDSTQFKQVFIKLKNFLPKEVRNFWEHAIANT